MFNPSQTDLHFAIQHAIGLDKITQFAEFADFDSDTITAILDEAAKIATNVIAPLNHLGDQQCSQWQADGSVRLPDGFHAAHTALSTGRMVWHRGGGGARRASPAPHPLHRNK